MRSDFRGKKPGWTVIQLAEKEFRGLVTDANNPERGLGIIKKLFEGKELSSEEEENDGGTIIPRILSGEWSFDSYDDIDKLKAKLVFKLAILKCLDSYHQNLNQQIKNQCNWIPEFIGDNINQIKKDLPQISVKPHMDFSSTIGELKQASFYLFIFLAILTIFLVYSDPEERNWKEISINLMKFLFIFLSIASAYPLVVDYCLYKNRLEKSKSDIYGVTYKQLLLEIENPNAQDIESQVNEIQKKFQ